MLHLALCLTALLAAPAGPDLAAFATLRADPPPPALTRNNHYWVSNEYRHDFYRETITDLGGVYVGVGADQNYLLAGWAKPEVLVLMDFDGAIPRLHRVYRLVFRAAETPEAFVAAWDEKNTAEVEGWIASEHGDGDEAKALRKAFRAARKSVHARLRWTLRAYGKRGVSTWLDDASQYGWIRQLWADGRVFPVRGDLTGAQTMRDIGAAARAAGLPVRLVYLSNAEQYFEYGTDFRANFAGLPFDDRSVVLHTLANGKFAKADGHYHYAWQSGLDFQAHLQDPKMRKIMKLVRLYARPLEEGYSRIVGPQGAQ